MRITILIFLALVAGCWSLSAQKRPVQDDVYFQPEDNGVTAQIPKGTKILTVTTDSTAAGNFKLVTETLLDNNIEIETYDKEMGTISTAFTPLKKTGSYKLKFRCKNNNIIVSGTFTSGISIELYGVRAEDTAMEIEKRGMKKSMYDITFGKMYDFAAQLGPVIW